MLGIVAVGISRSQGEDSLPDKIEDLVAHLLRLPFINNCSGDDLGQAQLFIHYFEQKRAAVGTQMFLGKADRNRFGKYFWGKDNLLWYIAHWESSFGCRTYCILTECRELSHFFVQTS